MKKLHFTFLLVSLGLLSLQAQTTINANETENTFSISGQIRPRFEVRSGTFQPIADGQEPAVLVSDRIRLQTDYTYKDWIQTRISIQNVSIWGQGNMVQATENGGNKLAIFEAWASVKLANNWNAKFGRQVISLDDERIFGALDWAQGARTHDALSIQYTAPKFLMKSFFAFNQNYRATYNNNISNPNGNLFNNNGAIPYKVMQTVWLQSNISKSSTVSALITNLGFQNAASATDSTKVSYYQTLGANYYFKQNKWNSQATAYYQMGKDANTDYKQNAYLLAAKLGYKLTEKWNVGAGVDYLSGNKLGATNTENKAFNPLYGTHHKFYGFMDYYYTGNAHGNVGLVDYYLNFGYAPNPKLSLGAAFHMFNSAAEIVGYDKSLGQEIDLTFNYNVNKLLNIQGGYSNYFTNNTLNYLKGVTNAKGLQQWLWLTINVTPKFFETKF